MEPVYKSPNPIKKKATVIERVSHWQTTLTGLALIGAAIYVLSMEMDNTMKGTTSTSLLAAGLWAIGYKPKSK